MLSAQEISTLRSPDMWWVRPLGTVPGNRLVEVRRGHYVANYNYQTFVTMNDTLFASVRNRVKALGTPSENHHG